MKKKIARILIAVVILGIPVVAIAHSILNDDSEQETVNRSGVEQTIIITTPKVEEEEKDEIDDDVELIDPDVLMKIMRGDEDERTEDLTPDATVEDVDPEELLKVSEAEARERGGYYIRRNGELYIVDVFYRSEGLAGGFGDRWVGPTKKSDYIITTYYREMRTYYYISIGQVPIITLKSGDELVNFGVDHIGNFFKAELRSYTIPIFIDNDRINMKRSILVDFDKEQIQLSNKSLETFEVRDENGEIVEDFRDLPYGKVYTVSWFEGVTYHEYKLVSNCNYYYSPGYNYSGDNYDEVEMYELPVELHKENYASFDFSHIPAGLYEFAGSFGRPAFIRIV